MYSLHGEYNAQVVRPTSVVDYLLVLLIR